MTPHLHITLINRKISSFHFFGVIGYVTGALLGVLLCYLLKLEVNIILLMAATGAATFFLMAFMVKMIIGRETIVYYHHEIAILIMCSIVLSAIGRPVLPYIDVTLLGIGVFLGFGRIGCFSVGCCHGRPHRHGVKYGLDHVQAGFTWYYRDVPLMPVQLIESGYVFLTVGVGIILLLNNVLPGTVLLCYTVIYGLMRFTLEFFRGDPERPSWLGLSEAQWTTFALTAVTLAMSYAGWLPIYTWHLVIFIVMGIVSLAVMVYNHKNEEYNLLKPSHIKQVAQCLLRAEGFNSFTNERAKGMVNLHSTTQGLCLSCDKYADGKEQVEHYTLSNKDGKGLQYASVKRIAELIGTLKRHNGRIDLIDKQNGVYHILFTE